MGNTKSYYIEGQLLRGVTLERFREVAADRFHYTYCVAQIVDEPVGYLVAAIHTVSLIGDSGPKAISNLFASMKVFRYSAETGDFRLWHWFNNQLCITKPIYSGPLKQVP